VKVKELKEMLEYEGVTDDTEVYFDDVYYPMEPADVNLVKDETGGLMVVVSPERG
jgi:hypothetical protein